MHCGVGGSHACLCWVTGQCHSHYHPATLLSAHISHFTAEVKGQLVVLLSQGRHPTPEIIPHPPLSCEEKKTDACSVKNDYYYEIGAKQY